MTWKKSDKVISAVSACAMTTKKLIWTFQTELRYGKAPTNTTKISLLYDDTTASASEENSSSRNSAPYANYTFQIRKLPRESRLIGNVSFSYNHNKSESNYLYGDILSNYIFNRYSEDAYLPSISLTYYTSLYK